MPHEYEDELIAADQSRLVDDAICAACGHPGSFHTDARFRPIPCDYERDVRTEIGAWPEVCGCPEFTVHAPYIDATPPEPATRESWPFIITVAVAISIWMGVLWKVGRWLTWW